MNDEAQILFAFVEEYSILVINDFESLPVPQYSQDTEKEGSMSGLLENGEASNVAGPPYLHDFGTYGRTDPYLYVLPDARRGANWRGRLKQTGPGLTAARRAPAHGSGRGPGWRGPSWWRWPSL